MGFISKCESKEILWPNIRRNHGVCSVTGKTPSLYLKTPVVEELYSFANGKFYSGMRFLTGATTSRKVKAALYKAYGQPSFVNEKLGIWKWKWQGTKIEVHLSVSDKILSDMGDIPELRNLRTIGLAEA